MSDEDYFVSNSVGYLIDDLNSDAGYSMLTEPQRIAVLLWVLHG